MAAAWSASKAHRLPLFWRILSYLFLFVVVNLLANLARVGMDALGLPPLASRLAFALVYIGGVVYLTYLYRRFIDRESWSGVALPALHNHLHQLGAGVIFGALVVAIVFGFEYVAQWIRVVGFAGGGAAGTMLADSLLLGAAFGVSEEICMRGYLFQNLAESRPLWQATLITGLIFGAFHLLSVGFGTRGLTFFILALLLNVFLILTRLATRSLWFAIGFHTAFDWAAINLGMGSVLLAEQHLLQITRGVALPAEDLLTAAAIALGIALLISRAWQRKRPFVWNAPLADESHIS